MPSSPTAGRRLGLSGGSRRRGAGKERGGDTFQSYQDRVSDAREQGKLKFNFNLAHVHSFLGEKSVHDFGLPAEQTIGVGEPDQWDEMRCDSEWRSNETNSEKGRDQ